MQIFEGKVWKFGDNISTDNLMPGFTRGTTPMERAAYCMRANRPEFAGQVKKGDIVIGGKNFGCGSSRPGGVNLILLGVSCVIAESFGRIFFRNTINMGFPLLYCPGVTAAFNEGEIMHADFNNGEIKNLTTGTTLHAEPLPPVVMKILDAGGVIPLLVAEYGDKTREIDLGALTELPF